jgi:hypothetical protein
MILTAKLINKILHQKYVLQIFLPEVSGKIIEAIDNKIVVQDPVGNLITSDIPSYAVRLEHQNERFLVRRN